MRTPVLTWVGGLLRRRLGLMLPAVLGVGLTIALLATLGIFINASAATMTRRALGDVPVDWQIQLVPGSNPALIERTLRSAVRVHDLEEVGYATVPALTATTGGTTQTTGEGKVLGVADSYWTHFPAELRPLLGKTQGILIAQQTAANLHVSLGDQVSIERQALPPISARIDGVVDLPQADSLFQAVGVPPGAAPQAPPDNVLIIPIAVWHQWFDPQAIVRPDSVRIQFHTRIDHALPADPNAAFIRVQQLANNFEAKIAGSGVVGDNLAARLDAVREDALYARVLFLFLGLPGAVLAMILTFAVSATGSARRRREQALLRVRGASTARVLRIESMEGILVAAGGVLLAAVITWIIVRQMVNAPLSGRQTLVVAIVALVIGVSTALAAVVVPAWRDTRQATVRAGRLRVGRETRPLWERTWIDVVLLVISGVVYWRAAATGYQIVLAPEGVAQTSVSYESFIAPLTLWLGVALLVTRLFRHGLREGRGVVAWLFRPITRSLTPVVAASVARQSWLITRGIVLVTLAFSFAVSTSIFNTTYNAQSRVDAELTNGADVTVTGSSVYPAGPLLDRIRRVPGVSAARTMIHRFAYVGNDLQDIYGIDPLNISAATDVSNAYFANKDAKGTLRALASRADGVLVSQETVNDFQLRIGDQINLRLQNARDHQYHPVPFHFLGVVREFPTAPKDSFIVANAAYVAAQSGSAAREIVLVRGSIPPLELAQRIEPVAREVPGAKVSDLGSTLKTISSSLTAVDLRGLTWIELSFAILLIAGASGLVLGLGIVERRREFALLAAMGATTRQLGSFLWTEALTILVPGAVIGVAMGFALARILVKVLTGVFDPAPEALSIPWLYLAILLIAGFASALVAVLIGGKLAETRTIESLRTI